MWPRRKTRKIKIPLDQQLVRKAQDALGGLSIDDTVAEGLRRIVEREAAKRNEQT